jgi:putative effector of murein hydrolase
MKNILYVVAVLLIIAWAVGYLLYNIEGLLIHLLLVIAVIAIVLNIYKHRKSI